MLKEQLILSSDDDFNTLLEALDALALSASSLSFTDEVIKAAVLAADQVKGEEEFNEKDFERKANLALNKGRIKDRASVIRDKIIIMKAKVVLTKELLQNKALDKQVTDLMKEVS